MTPGRHPIRKDDYLDHTAEAIQQACCYVEGMTKADFPADPRTQDAVILKLLIVGEAAAQLVAECADIVDQNSEIPRRSDASHRPKRSTLVARQPRFRFV